MRILVTSLPDIKRITPQRPQHLLSYLARDHEVRVFCVNAWWLPEPSDDYLLGLIEKLDISYVTDRHINPVLQELYFTRKFRNLIDRETFDVYVNLNTLIAGFWVSQKMKKRGIPTVFDIGDDLPEKVRIAAQIPRPLKQVAYDVGKYLFEKNIASFSRNTVVTQSLLRSYPFPASTSVVMPNGVDLNLFRSDVTCSKRAELGMEDDFVLGFVGVLRREVNLQPVFRALKHLLDAGYEVRMLVVGAGEKLHELKSLARICRLSGKVHFTGSVLSCELAAYIACMDACVISYDMTQDNQNACPLKLFEYMACGKPVISADVSGVREIAQGRVLYATSADEIVQAVRDLYWHSEKAERMGRDGIEFVGSNYSWEAIGARFEQIVCEVVDE